MHPLAQTTREFLEEMVRNSSATLRRPPPGRGRAPGPRIHTVGGALGPITTDLMGSLEGYWRDYGDVVRLRFMAATAHLVSDPEAIGHVLQENHRSYSKRSRGLYMLRLILGNGLLTSDGEFWLRQRRIAQPSFAKRRIEGFAQTMVAEAEDVATAWRAAGSHSTDLTRAMSQLTLQVISKCAFGASLKSQAGEIYDAVHFTTEDAHHRVNELFGAFVQPPTRRNQAFRHHAGTLDRIVYGLIEARRRGGPTDDLLGMLLEARDTDTGEGMTDKQLRDEVMTIFLAGHETTANLLTWTFYLLDQHPWVLAGIREEVEREAPDGKLSAEVAGRLSYTERVLKETLRLRPPAWIIERYCEADDEIAGYAIPKGSTVLIPTWIVHRHPKFWDRPDDFEPDRFLEPPRHRFAYLPFGGGPRLCIGSHFALMEAKLILATLCREFDVEVLDRQVTAEPHVTLRPRGGLRVRISPRVGPTQRD